MDVYIETHQCLVQLCRPANALAPWLYCLHILLCHVNNTARNPTDKVPFSAFTARDLVSKFQLADISCLFVQHDKLTICRCWILFRDHSMQPPRRPYIQETTEARFDRRKARSTTATQRHRRLRSSSRRCTIRLGSAIPPSGRSPPHCRRSAWLLLDPQHSANDGICGGRFQSVLRISNDGGADYEMLDEYFLATCHGTVERGDWVWMGFYGACCGVFGAGADTADGV